MAFLYDLGNFKHCLWYVALFKVPPLCKKSYFSYILQYTIWMVIDLSSMVQVQKIQLHNFVIFLFFPSQTKRWLLGHLETRMSLNDIRSNSNRVKYSIWKVFENLPHWRCYIQFWNFKLSCSWEGIMPNILGYDFLSTKFLCSWDTYDVIICFNIKKFLSLLSMGFCCNFTLGKLPGMPWKTS